LTLFPLLLLVLFLLLLLRCSGKRGPNRLRPERQPTSLLNHRLVDWQRWSVNSNNVLNIQHIGPTGAKWSANGQIKPQTEKEMTVNNNTTGKTKKN
jgi:hypothetical protein